MRTFGMEKPETMQFQLEGSERVYEVPLSASLPYSELLKLSEANSDSEGFKTQVEMLRRYMGDVVDEIQSGVLSEIMKAWAEESGTQGASVGES